MNEELFPRLRRFPPYIFAEIDEAKMKLRRQGEDIIDLGMGNPDPPPPQSVVEKVRETILNAKSHRYSASKGLVKLREAICSRYRKFYGVELDPETEAVVVMGTKEGIFQLILTMIVRGEIVLVPDPTYPIHFYSGVMAGGEVRSVPLLEGDFFDNLVRAVKDTWPRPKLLLLSFPHNPTTICVEEDFFRKVIDFAREFKIKVIHDFAYADLTFDGYKAPSILQIAGAKDVAVEFYSMSKSFSMAGFRVGFAVGNRDMIWALAKIKSYIDYGMFQPIQIASIIALRDNEDYPREIAEIYRSRRDVLCDGLKKFGWDVELPKGTMFVWAKIPEPFAGMGSLEFSKLLLHVGKVAVSPGVGFGRGGEGYVRFALVENEHRTRQALRGMRWVFRLNQEGKLSLYFQSSLG